MAQHLRAFDLRGGGGMERHGSIIGLVIAPMALGLAACTKGPASANAAGVQADDLGALMGAGSGAGGAGPSAVGGAGSSPPSDADLGAADDGALGAPMSDGAAATPSPDLAPNCTLVPGNYKRTFTPAAGSTCRAPAPVTVVVPSAPVAGCTASTNMCVTTTTCTRAANLQNSTSTTVLTVMSGGTAATGRETVKTTDLQPPGCIASVFCPPGWCLSLGYCYDNLTTTCVFDFTQTKIP
jgi:hypothetical protein